MVHAFQTRISVLSDTELLQYLTHFQDYRTEAVEAALAELDRRGLALPGDDLARIRSGLEQRAAAAQAQLNRSFVTGFGNTSAARLARIRQITGGILATGLCGATVIYLLAAPRGANPLGFEPEDSKKYLHDIEVYGGKVNLLATQIRGAWNDLWQGRNLAFTVAGLAILLAFAFWFIATRRVLDLKALEEEASPGRSSPPGS